MYAHFMRRQLVAARESRQSPTAMDRLTGACWPGGAQDRLEPVALTWVQRWHPATAAIPLPLCGCAAGRCTICN